ncbi:MAG: HepT-like ribonuclease domain-containing protein [Gammaproteobacteria bacterium]
MRNVLIHGYARVDNATVWRAATEAGQLCAVPAVHVKATSSKVGREEPLCKHL